jgi:SAM-dependent methyltransferase
LINAIHYYEGNLVLEEAHLALHTLEEGHWWFVGARAVYRSLLSTGLGEPKKDRRMLEIGCGSGGNLALLEEYGPTVGVDISSLALSLIHARPTLGLVQASATALPFVESSFEGVNLFGVIEHLDDDEYALGEAARVCRSGGVLTLLTSALPILWSHHDEANLHKRRYYPKELLDKLQRAGWKPIRLSFENFITFFPTLLIRFFQRLSPQSARYDMGRTPTIINNILLYILCLEARAIKYISLPIGVDLVTVSRLVTGPDKRNLGYVNPKGNQISKNS